jgi:hypothetical protein
VVEEFHQLHKESFTFSLPWVSIEIINLRITAKVKSQKIPVTKIAAGTTIEPNGYLVLYEDLSFGNENDPGCYEPFALSENGERLYLARHK